MRPLIVLTGPTASGKTALSLALARRFGAEILSCDSVTVYRHMDLGTAKPSPAERAAVPHHCLDLFDPDQACTAGDWSREARRVLGELAKRNRLPIIAGGSGLYLRALLDGLHPAPPADAALRALLRRRAESRTGSHLHRTLSRLDAAAAARIHPNDASKLIRAIEVSVASRRPMSEAWAEPTRDALAGYRVLRLALAPPREELYARINQRAEAMFSLGLVEETSGLIARFGLACRPFTSLGYAEASAVLRGELDEPEAIRQAQQGHRNYAKRQGTWFRREAELHPTFWLEYPGDTEEVTSKAEDEVERFLRMQASKADREPESLSPF